MIEPPKKVFLSDDCLHTYLKTASKAPENTAGSALTNTTRHPHKPQLRLSGSLLASASRKSTARGATTEGFDDPG